MFYQHVDVVPDDAQLPDEALSAFGLHVIRMDTHPVIAICKFELCFVLITVNGYIGIGS
jgi:hypothetical protein